MTIQRSQVKKAFMNIINEKNELSAVDRANVLSSLEIDNSIPNWLQEEVIEARNKLKQTIQIQEFLQQRDGKIIDVSGEYRALDLLRQNFPLADQWAEELKESRNRKE